MVGSFQPNSCMTSIAPPHLHGHEEYSSSHPCPSAYMSGQMPIPKSQTKLGIPGAYFSRSPATSSRGLLHALSALCAFFVASKYN